MSFSSKTQFLRPYLAKWYKVLQPTLPPPITTASAFVGNSFVAYSLSRRQTCSYKTLQNWRFSPNLQNNTYLFPARRENGSRSRRVAIERISAINGHGKRKQEARVELPYLPAVFVHSLCPSALRTGLHVGTDKVQSTRVDKQYRKSMIRQDLPCASLSSGSGRRICRNSLSSHQSKRQNRPSNGTVY